MLVRHVKGQLALCHNGNLTNSFELRKELELQGCIFQTTSDTEVISYLITRNRLQSGSIEEAVLKTMKELKGSIQQWQELCDHGLSMYDNAGIEWIEGELDYTIHCADGDTDYTGESRLILATGRHTHSICL